MTPQQIDAMKLALEALEQTTHAFLDTEGSHGRIEQEATDAAYNAITALEEVLAEHAMREVQRLGREIEQEPVAWVSEDVCEGQYINGRPRKIWWECNKGVGTAFYTRPPQRTWVGLTGLDQKELMAMSARDAVFATEAKLKEKNT
jgi:hypothetical protein